MVLFKDVPRIDKAYWTITVILRLSILPAFVSAVLDRQWEVMFLSVLVFLLTFLPRLVERNYSIHLPVEFQMVILLFVYATLFLGNIQGYYTLFWWWDMYLHTGSGIILGLVGFLIMYALDRGGKIQTSPILMMVFAFSFAVAIGALWEIFEFSMDQLFGYNMQRSGLTDTMWDLIVDCVGAFASTLMGYFYLIGKSTKTFDAAIHRFVEKNPRLFS